MRITIILAIVLLCVGACGGDLGGKPTTTRNLHPDNPAFDSLAARPVELPSASGGQCPVAEAQLLSPTQPYVLGDGPVYPTGLDSSATLRIAEVPVGGEWLGNYVIWLAPPWFSGKALIRGGRIDTDGELRFDYAPTVPREPTSDKLQFDTETTSPDPEGWWQWASYARMKEPGCYAFQVDTDDETYTIVFRAEVQ
jgi:hypothetical protein